MEQYCSHCGRTVTAAAKFCPHCGQPLTAQSFQQPDPIPAPFSPTQNAAQTPPDYPVPEHVQQSSAASDTGNAPQKKGKTALFLGLGAVTLAGLAAVACFVWPGFLKQRSASTEVTTPTALSATQASVLSSEALSVTEAPAPSIPVTASTATPPDTTEAPATEPPVTVAPTTAPVNPFADLTVDDPCYPEYLWAYEHGLVHGNQFASETVLTRGDAITMLWKAYGSPTAAQDDMPFQDVTVSDNCYPAVLWAFGAKLISVPEDASFHPNDVMNRDQASLILCLAAGGDGSGQPKAYLDVSSKKYFYGAVNWGCAAGIFERNDDFRFRPTDPLLRGEFACWLARVHEPAFALNPSIPEGDSFADYGIEINLQQNGTAFFNAQAQNDPTVTRRLKVTAESYELFDQAEGYPARDGYEWRRGVFLIGYGDEDADSFVYSLYADVNSMNYVSLFEHSSQRSEDGTKTAWIIYNGIPQKVYVSPLIAEKVENALYRVSYAVQVPIGYDSIVVRFNSVENEFSTGELFYEKYNDPANFVFFQYE